MKYPDVNSNEFNDKMDATLKKLAQQIINENREIEEFSSSPKMQSFLDQVISGKTVDIDDIHYTPGKVLATFSDLTIDDILLASKVISSYSEVDHTQEMEHVGSYHAMYKGVRKDVLVGQGSYWIISKA